MNKKTGQCIKMIDRSYGFLQDENCDDYFVHFSSILNRRDHSLGFLQVGDFCEFDVIKGKNGFEAVNVVIL